MKAIIVKIVKDWSDSVRVYPSDAIIEDWVKGDVIENISIVCKSMTKTMSLPEAIKEGYHIDALTQSQIERIMNDDLAPLRSLHAIRHDAYNPMRTADYGKSADVVFWGDRIEICVKKYVYKEGYNKEIVLQEAQSAFKSGYSYSTSHAIKRID